MNSAKLHFFPDFRALCRYTDTLDEKHRKTCKTVAVGAVEQYSSHISKVEVMEKLGQQRQDKIWETNLEFAPNEKRRYQTFSK